MTKASVTIICLIYLGLIGKVDQGSAAIFSTDWEITAAYSSDGTRIVEPRIAEAESHSGNALPVPEPSSLILLGAGLLTLGLLRKGLRKR